MDVREFLSKKGYNLEKKIGQGSYAVVYKAIRLSDNSEVAVKVISVQNFNKKQMENAINEIRIICSIDHPNIVKYFDAQIDQKNKDLYVFMEYLAGGDLSQRISSLKRAKTNMGEKMVWRYTLQILQGLKALHQRQIIHRDIKPGNLFLSRDFKELKIGDLNTSKIMGDKKLTNTVIGTPYYLAPEIWRSSRYDYRCDVFSMGCVVYEMATLKPPFKGNSVEDLYKLIKKGNYEALGKKFTKELQRFVEQCLLNNYKARPSVKKLIDSEMMRYQFVKHDDLDLRKQMLTKPKISLTYTKIPESMKEVKAALDTFRNMNQGCTPPKNKKKEKTFVNLQQQVVNSYLNKNRKGSRMGGGRGSQINYGGKSPKKNKNNSKGNDNSIINSNNNSNSNRSSRRGTLKSYGDQRKKSRFGTDNNFDKKAKQKQKSKTQASMPNLKKKDSKVTLYKKKVEDAASRTGRVNPTGKNMKKSGVKTDSNLNKKIPKRLKHSKNQKTPKNPKTLYKTKKKSRLETKKSTQKGKGDLYKKVLKKMQSTNVSKSEAKSNTNASQRRNKSSNLQLPNLKNRNRRKSSRSINHSIVTADRKDKKALYKKNHGKNSILSKKGKNSRGGIYFQKVNQGNGQKSRRKLPNSKNTQKTPTKGTKKSRVRRKTRGKDKTKTKSELKNTIKTTQTEKQSHKRILERRGTLSEHGKEEMDLPKISIIDSNPKVIYSYKNNIKHIESTQHLNKKSLVPLSRNSDMADNLSQQLNFNENNLIETGEARMNRVSSTYIMQQDSTERTNSRSPAFRFKAHIQMGESSPLMPTRGSEFAGISSGSVNDNITKTKKFSIRRKREDRKRILKSMNFGQRGTPVNKSLVKNQSITSPLVRVYSNEETGQNIKYNPYKNRDKSNPSVPKLPSPCSPFKSIKGDGFMIGQDPNHPNFHGYNDRSQPNGRQGLSEPPRKLNKQLSLNMFNRDIPRSPSGISLRHKITSLDKIPGGAIIEEDQSFSTRPLGERPYFNSYLNKNLLPT